MMLKLSFCLLILGSGVLLAGCASPKSATTSEQSSGSPNPLPNITLRTQDNQKVRFYDDLVKGKVVIINFLYTKCSGKCPGITKNLLDVQTMLGEKFGRDIYILSITLDPLEDTPDSLKEYAADLGAKPGWYFLTGNLDDITMLRRKLGVFDRDPIIDADKTQHSGLIVYGNETRGRWAAAPGLQRPEWIVRSLLRL